MLLLAGDIFDNARVSDQVVEFFLEQVGRLSVPVVLLPGNHDLYGEGSVYHRPLFRSGLPNLYVFTRSQGEIIAFPELTLEVWGRAMPCHAPEFKPLAGMPSSHEGRWLVALAHGHFHFPHDVERRSSPIFPWEVAQATCDYLALGHWERHEDVSQGRVKAVYSGSPRGPSRSDPLGAVAVVDLDPIVPRKDGVRLSRAPLAMM
jgi:DNA repair exonuclease SbcCD nuclease subunit